MTDIAKELLSRYYKWAGEEGVGPFTDDDGRLMKEAHDEIERLKEELENALKRNAA